MGQPTSAFRPQLEALEDRQLLATRITFDASQTVMTMRGDNRPNVIQLFDDGSGAVGNISGTVDGRDISQWTGTRAIRRILIDTGGGNDIVEYTLAPPGGTVVNGNMAMTARLGNGNDRFAVSVDNVDLVGGFYDFQIFGGRGNDDLTATAVNTNLFNRAQLNFFLYGEDGRDSIIYRQSGFVDLNSVHNFLGNGGRGDDFVSGQARVTPFSQGTVNVDVQGGLGFDRLDLVAEFDPPFARTNMRATIDGGVPPIFGLARHFYRQWEDITMSANVNLVNVDPRSRITFIVV